MSLELKGKIIELLPEQSGTSAKGEWLKRGFVIETSDTYPKKIAIDVFKNEVKIPNIGTEATVSVNIESRDYNGKWYSNITAWKVEPINGGVAPNPVNDALNTPAPPTEGNDNLPF